MSVLYSFVNVVNNEMFSSLYICGKWNSLYLDLKPRKLMGHGKVVGLGLWAEGKARKEVVRERVESWVIMLKTELDTTVNPFPWKRNALACLEHG